MIKNKKIILLILSIIFLGAILIPKTELISYASFDASAAKSAILIEKNSGKVLIEHNSNARLPIASVTKLMTVLLTLEKVDSKQLSLEDKITVSRNASGMGGSQIFLDANCEYVLGDLLKSVIVASANDSSVAIAEYIAGSENNFVKLMNEKAKELNMNDTNYVNCTGLPSAEGYSSAYDQAIVLSKVLNFDAYHNYSSIWNEEFAHPSGRTTQMTNTNKLSRFYEGCIGGKTGSTNQAKFCLAVGAKRGDTELISVVLGAENSKTRFKLASDLLNYGFENFVSKTIFCGEDLQDKTIQIKGLNKQINLKAEREFTYICGKNENVNYNVNYNLPTMLRKVNENEVVGNVEIVIDGVVVDVINILSTETVNEASIWDYFKDIVNS